MLHDFLFYFLYLFILREIVFTLETENHSPMAIHCVIVSMFDLFYSIHWVGLFKTVKKIIEICEF